MKNLRGTICITKSHGEDEEMSIRITLRDDDSRCPMFEVRLSPEEFSNGMFGLAYRPCKIEIRSNPDLWGMKRENKRELIPKPEKFIYDSEEEKLYLIEAVKPWEVDGWKAAVSQALSTQQTNSEFYSVTFFKYMEKVEEE